VPVTAALAGLVVIGWASATSNFDEWHPKPTSIAYVLDADTRTANWVTADDQVSGWTAQFFPAGAQRSTFAAMPNSNPDRFWPAWQAPATSLALAAPELTVLEDRATDGQRALRFHLSSPRGAANLYVDVQAPGSVVAADIEGKPLDLSAWPAQQRARFRLVYHGLRSEGVDLGLTLAEAGPVSVSLEDRSNGLPDVAGLTITPRPPDTMPAPFEMSDPTIVRRSVVLPGAPE
jgi:hypothetical protein